jgi:hypothetical protein
VIDHRSQFLESSAQLGAALRRGVHDFILMAPPTTGLPFLLTRGALLIIISR